MSLNLDKSTWKRVAFGDVIDSITDRVDDPPSAGVDRYVGLEHLDPGILTVERWDSPDKVEAQKLRFRPGDVIFGRRRAYQKKVARADFEGICSAHALVLRAKSGVMDPDFLPVFLASDYFLDRAISISVGSLSPTVNWRDLRVEQFDLPPFDDQKRIADLLWALFRNRQSVIRQKSSLSTARRSYIENFLAASAVEAVPLIETAEVTSGITLGPVRRKYTMPMPYLRVANVQRGKLDLSEIKDVGVTEEEARTKALRCGDVLVVEGHASVDEVGRAARWTRHETALFQNHLFRVRAVEDFDGRYLLEAINSVGGRRYIRTVAKSTSGLNTINSTALKALPVPALPLTAQARLVAGVGELDQGIVYLEDELTALSTLRHELSGTIFGAAS